MASVVVIVSCKSNEETQAEQTIAEYEKFVDSLNQVTMDEAEPNLAKIEAEFEIRSQEAEKGCKSCLKRTCKKLKKLKRLKQSMLNIQKQ